MTGFGEAHRDGDSFGVHLELRSVNHRHLNLSVRGPEPYPMLEADIEKVLRRTIRRGSITLHIRIARRDGSGTYRLNGDALLAYVKQVESVLQNSGLDRYTTALLPGVLQLPAITQEVSGTGRPPAAEWAVFEDVLIEATGRLQAMRLDEGKAMAAELGRLAAGIRGQLDAVSERVPHVVSSFRERLRERISAALASESVRVADEHLVREVALFADRCDINEEIARLVSHLVQFGEILAGESDSPGRKLEFVTQEMGREANTIGSKASDAAVSRAVVEIKSALDKIRELIQNVE